MGGLGWGEREVGWGERGVGWDARGWVGVGVGGWGWMRVGWGGRGWGVLRPHIGVQRLKGVYVFPIEVILQGDKGQAG